MSSDDRQAALAREVENLEKRIHSEMASRRRAVRTAKFVSLFLGAMVLFFVGINYFHARSQWTEEKFKRSLEQELTEFTPFAMQELNAMGRELAPVYAAESRKQLRERMPEISRAFRQELDQTTTDLLGRVHSRLLKAEQRVLAHAEEVVFEAYPGLGDSEARARLERRFRAITEQAAVAAVSDFHARFSRDLDEVRETLFKLDLRDPDASTVDLQKRFLSLWLRLLEQEIMEL